jgi:hypothetical protein
MAIQITTDGKIVKMKARPTLAELHEAVGGYIEYVPIMEWAKRLTGCTHMYCNDEGKLMGLPLNHLATEMMLSDNDVIVGNVVLMTDDDDLDREADGEEE